MINRLHRQCLWHHLPQLICRGRVLQAQKVLQHLSCRLQVMFSTCHPVQQSLIKGTTASVAESTGCDLHPTSIGSCPLEEQLEPNFKGGPRESKSFDDLCMLRKQIPKMDNRTFDQIYPNDNVIRVVQKTHGVHEVKMREVAAWVLNGTHWFSLLKQPMMIVIWCRDWSDAAKFQYLMQILQVQFQDYVPRYHILLSRKRMLISLSSIGKSQQLYGMVNRSLVSWQRRIPMIYRQLVSRTSIQCGHFQLPLSTRTGNRTFGMAPWHLVSDADRSKEALQSQSPIAAFKACNVIQAIGIAYSKIVLPSGDSKGESKNRTYCPTTWNNSYTWQYAADYADQLRQVHASALLCQECTLLVRVQLSRKNQIIQTAHLQIQRAPSCVVQ